MLNICWLLCALCVWRECARRGTRVIIFIFFSFHFPAKSSLPPPAASHSTRDFLSFSVLACCSAPFISPSYTLHFHKIALMFVRPSFSIQVFLLNFIFFFLQLTKEKYVKSSRISSSSTRGENISDLGV